MKQTYLLKLCTIAFLLMLPLGALAQTVKGKVTDSTGEGLPYMNIVEKGTANGVTSDDLGAFSITVSSLPSTLVISSMGYASRTIEVTSTSFLTIVMKEDNALDEIILVGSRTAPRSNA
ncbi:MAG: carboxypeptidase-like regulatory domain-containing protein, partial [Polaribacter sp.]|nr:carboxypeptidase-like regulatory domain-containing protein [Polaribacter sp.]